MLRTSGLCFVLSAALTCLAGAHALAADDGVWSVSKSSGEVWITTTGAQAASLKQEDTLKPGDTIRTGRNGRVLLMRGEETILIAPNSVIGVPVEKKDGMSTTIEQQAGSILLDVEKRNVKHFEVETPYLAAVVKGTHFSVTVTGKSAQVEVERGQVEVSDFKSGQIAEVMPGQAATTLTHGKPGLSLSGSGPFNPIAQGKPRASTLQRIPVPKGGLPAPHNVGDGRTVHALAPVGKGLLATPSQRAHLEHGSAKQHVIHISTSLGEVRLNVQKATHGLAHGATAPGLSRSASRDSAKDTIWDNSNSNASTTTGDGQSTAGHGNAAGAGGSSSVSATTVAATTGAASNSNKGNGGNNDNGNGATGNGKTAGNGNGNGGNNGNHGNGNNGNGNGGNGNGNGGAGNGNGNGNGKH